MKDKVRINLINIFNRHFEQIKDTTFPDFIDIVLGDNPEAYNLNTGTMGNLYDEEELSKLNKLKQSKQLNELYDAVIAKLNPTYTDSENYKIGILSSLEIIRTKVNSGNKGFENQIIFIQYDYDPIACFCGFGPGDYPILEEPKYIDFNYKEELFNGVGEISYAEFWKEKIEFDEMLSEMDEEIDMGDLIFSTEIYDHLKSAYKFKTDLMLFEAFDQISLECFEGIPIKHPLYIYSNEHDCEVMNVYVYE